MTRIQILRYAADKLAEIQPKGVQIAEYKYDTSSAINNEVIQRKFTVIFDSKVDKGKINKATIEQYRRRLERIEYDRIHSILGDEKKLWIN
ncbi:unnamed protein product [Heterobilharzia americana]|nr:unnamed protein product [Heterobilharzia americana]